MKPTLKIGTDMALDRKTRVNVSHCTGACPLGLVVTLLFGCAVILPGLAQARNGETGGIGGTGISRETGGIGGTGISRSGMAITGYGPIQAFGSVFVNGREYAIDSRTLVMVDGAPATVSALHVGDIAEINGVITTARGGYARGIAVLHPIIGQATDISGDGRSAVVLGQRVIAVAGQAPFAGVSSGALVAVSALPRPSGDWVAQRVTLLPSGNNFQLAAIVTSLAPGRLSVAGTSILASTNLTAQISTGERVIVVGSISPYGLQATTVTASPVVLGQPGTVVEVQNYFQANGHGQLIAADGMVASGAPAGLVLKGEQLVEIRGDLNAVNSISIEQIDTNTPGEPDVNGLSGRAGSAEPREVAPQTSDEATKDIDKAATDAVRTPANPALPNLREPPETAAEHELPELDLQDLHPEIPEIEIPEIPGPSDD